MSGKKNRNEKEKVKLLQSEVKKLKKEKQIDYKSNYDSEKYSKSVRNVLSYIEENYHQDISLESAATEVFMNKIIYPVYSVMKWAWDLQSILVIFA